jgi:hypothetical protein
VALRCRSQPRACHCCLGTGGFGPPPPPAVGSVYGGGFFAGQISTAGNGIADYNLVIGPKASAQSKKAGKTSNTGGDPTSVINGPANSAAMNSATYPAAQFCEGLTIGGFSDWYMPAQNELEVCYYNLKPTTTANYTSAGINPNAVPARASNYTSGNPAQTSATVFQTAGAQRFVDDFYFSSTQDTGNVIAAVTQYFGYGLVQSRQKAGSYKVRAVRRVAV